METVHFDFDEGIADALFETQQSNAYMPAVNSAGPGDEDEEEDEEENDDDKGKSSDDKGKSSDDNDPPIDEEVVHSPLSPQTGGKPK